jgi:nucleotidyltransferase substrate binding protein (TIGR01987 family)
MVDIKDLDLSSFEKAVKSLKSGTSKTELSELERDGVIQRFEYTFELAWKTLRRVLIAMGRSEVSSSPKPIIRDALQEGYIKDVELWFRFLEARNLTTHIYSSSQAAAVLEVAKEFSPNVEELLKKIKDLK